MAKQIRQLVCGIPGVLDTVTSDKLLENVFAKSVSKLGIQAPIGTQFALKLHGVSTEINCIIGRTGIYELDENNLIVDSLRFIPEYKKEKDLNTTNDYLTVGEKITTAAVQNRDFRFFHSNWDDENNPAEKIEHTEQLGNSTTITYYTYKDASVDRENISDVPMNERIEIEDLFYQEYLQGRQLILQGKNGIYTNNGTPLPFKNIIIDYVEEE